MFFFYYLIFSSEIARRVEQTFTLNIQQPDGKSISLQFPGKQTILDVKTDVYTITDIAVRHQDWTGWPSGAFNMTTLAVNFKLNISK